MKSKSFFLFVKQTTTIINVNSLLKFKIYFIEMIDQESIQITLLPNPGQDEPNYGMNLIACFSNSTHSHTLNILSLF